MRSALRALIVGGILEQSQMFQRKMQEEINIFEDCHVPGTVLGICSQTIPGTPLFMSRALHFRTFADVSPTGL